MKTSIKLITITLLMSVVAVKAETEKVEREFNPPNTFGLGLEHLGKSVAEIGTLGAVNLEKDANGNQETGNAFGNGFENLGQGVVEVGTLGLGNTESQKDLQRKAKKTKQRTTTE